MLVASIHDKHPAFILKRAFNLITFLLIVCVGSAAVPRKVVYQGRLLDHSTLKPIPGNFTKDFLVLIRKLNNAVQASAPLLSRKITDVVINDGLFTLTIDVQSVGSEPPLTFDEPYFLEVIMGDQATGGKVGQQVFASHPFAFGVENAILLKGLSANSFALNSHGHSSSGTASFTIDGSNQTKSAETQFEIRNDRGPVFVVDENAKLSSVRNIIASSEVLSGDGFKITKLVNSNSIEIVRMTTGGNLEIGTKSEIGRVSIAGHLQMTSQLDVYDFGQKVPPSDHGNFTFDGNLEVVTGLIFGPLSAIKTLGTTNIVGKSHTLEDHLIADLFTFRSNLESLTGGTFGISRSLHFHNYSNAEVSDFPNNLIKSDFIADGQLINSHFQNDDPNDLIEDIKLATISTPGKIALSAVPANVVLKSGDSDFTNPFPLTRTDFDSLKSKSLSIISSIDDRIDGAFPLLTVKDNDITRQNLFQLLIKSSGDLVYSREVSPLSSFGFESPGDRRITRFTGNQIRFEGLQESGDTDFFDGSMIANGSITTVDLAASSITNAKLKANQAGLVSGLATDDFQINSITTAKLEGSLSGISIRTGAVITDKIRNSAITANLIEDGTLLGEDFENGTLSTRKFANKSLTGEKIASGTLMTIDFCSGDTCLDSELLVSDNFADDAFTQSKLTTSGTLIANRKLSAEVLSSRTLSMKISTSTSIPLTLEAVDNIDRMTFIEMILPQFAFENDFESGMEIVTTTGRRIVGMNNNGTLSLSFESDNVRTYVTMTPRFLAPLFKVEDKSGDCGNGDNDMLMLAGNLSSDYRSDCISKDLNHGIAPLEYKNAMQTCQSEGYQICDVSQYLNACKGGLLSNLEHSFGQQLLSTSAAVVFQVDVSDDCANKDSFSIGSAELTTTTVNFRCCLKY